jgi:hypothetical protein
MEIIRHETIKFSDQEQRCFDMVYMLMENLYNCATDPELRRHAEHITAHMDDVYGYFEEE